VTKIFKTVKGFVKKMDSFKP